MFGYVRERLSRLWSWLKWRVLGFYGTTNSRDFIFIASILILVIGLVIRLTSLGVQSLWIDELYSVQAGRINPFDAFAASHGNIVVFIGSWDVGSPPLYYWIIGVFEQFGHGDAWIRLPSVLFGVATIPLLYKLGELLFSRRVGLLASALLVMSPFHVWFSQEARCYSMMAFLTMLATLAYVLCLRKGFNGRRQVLFILAAVAAIYTHYHAIIFVGALATHWFITAIHSHYMKKLQNFDRKPIYAFSAIAVLSALSIANFLKGYNRLGANYENSYMGNFSNITLFKSDVLGPFTVTYGVPANSFLPLALLGVAIFSAALVMFYFKARTYKNTALLLSLLVFMPFAIIYASVFNTRYIVFIYPAYLLIIAQGMVELSELNLMAHLHKLIKWNRLARAWRYLAILSLVAIVFSANAFVLSQLLDTDKKWKEDWKSSVNYVEASALPGDLVLTAPYWNEKSIRHYMQREDVTIEIATNCSYLENVTGSTWFVMSPYVSADIHLFIQEHYVLEAEFFGRMAVYRSP